MVNDAFAFSQPELGKYFEWIIIAIKSSLTKKVTISLPEKCDDSILFKPFKERKILKSYSHLLKMKTPVSPQTFALKKDLRPKE